MVRLPSTLFRINRRPQVAAVLVNIRSLWNVGAIFRTADAVGIERLYLCGITPSPFDRFGKVRPQLHKVALGAERTVPWEKVASAPLFIGRLKREGYRIFAIEQSPSALPYWRTSSMKRPFNRRGLEKVALVLGNEVSGLSASILQRCDKILEIPMRGKKESLNVAVAFGVVAFHLVYVHG